LHGPAFQLASGVEGSENFPTGILYLTCEFERWFGAAAASFLGLRGNCMGEQFGDGPQFGISGAQSD